MIPQPGSSGLPILGFGRGIPEARASSLGQQGVEVDPQRQSADLRILQKRRKKIFNEQRAMLKMLIDQTHTW